MPKQTDEPDNAKQSILAGPEVVRKFLDSLANDPALDASTVSVIHQLYQDNKLTHTNLLSKLEGERKVSGE
jgi:hypothetical protein